MHTKLYASAALAILLSAPLHAQAGRDAEGFHAGLSLLGGIPTGDFGDQVDGMFGAGAHLLYRVGDDGNVGVRLDASWLLHGVDDREVVLASPLGGVEEVELTTTHSAVFLGLGPEFSLELAGARPYLGASIGLAYFLTEAVTDWSEDDDDVRFMTRIQHDDLALAYAGQTGVLIPITRGDWAVSADFGVRYQRSAEIDFLDDDDIAVELGRIVLDPVTAEASIWVLKAGISIAFGDDDD